MREWISVNERMPDENSTVIAFVDGVFVVSAQFRGGCFFDILKDENGFLFETISRDVTHWMQLPEPPK